MARGQSYQHRANISPLHHIPVSTETHAVAVVPQGLWTMQCQHDARTNKFTAVPFPSCPDRVLCACPPEQPAQQPAPGEGLSRMPSLKPTTLTRACTVHLGLLSPRHRDHRILCPTAVPTNVSQRCSLSKGLEMDKLSGENKDSIQLEIR